MWFRTLFGSLDRRISPSPARKRGQIAAGRHTATRRLRFESLEDRRLLSVSAAVDYPVGLNPQAVAAADFNGDGRLDLATANYSSSVSVLLGNANGTFQPAQESPTGTSPLSLAVGDFNADGKLDLATANAGDVSVLLGNGNGTFQPPHAVVLPAQFPPGYTGSDPLAQTPASLAVGDLNADGKLDLVAGGWTRYTVEIGYDEYGNPIYDYHTDGYVNVLLGNGDGTFGPGHRLSRQRTIPLVA